MAQPPRSMADDLRVHIDTLTALERRMRLGLFNPTEVSRVRAGLDALFPPPPPRLVNPPLAITATGAWW